MKARVPTRANERPNVAPKAIAAATFVIDL